ncbi:ferritin [Tessaracoccus bendigoensis DSM 12906]|uniref:Ferritin n=1 Tax=Tessaracoccus bendigoensis DSM 12906 TaxID=1123357 RepID=A0A1M6IFR4_9ACTN|nr:ferritin [Tessaracoccus bendigoensis]SHJ33233.1 ferritin [Tessaracoccus bendigoensis DSM 12906]
MKLSLAMLAKFNDQITLEFASSMAYRQLAIEMDVQDLPGMALWLRHQADEEVVHANKFIDHVVDRDDHPTIGSVAAPDVRAGSTPSEVFSAALRHEQVVSESIRNLYRAAEAEGDIDSRPLLNWFVDEQIEEESTVNEILARIRLVGSDGPGLLRLDEELGSRPAGSTENTGR